MPNKIEAVEAKIRELVPSTYCVVANHGQYNEIVKVIELELHHVLQAFSVNGDIVMVNEDGWFYIGYPVAGKEKVRWNLSLPLSGQREETILFIDNLLK